MSFPSSLRLWRKIFFTGPFLESGVTGLPTPAQGAEHADGVIAKLLVKDGSAPDEKTAVAKLKSMSGKEIEKYLRLKSAQDFLEVYPEGKLIGMIMFPNCFGDGTVLPIDFYGTLKAGKLQQSTDHPGNEQRRSETVSHFNPRFTPWRNDGSLFKDPAKTELYDLVAQYQSDGWKVMAVDQLARILRSEH